MENTIPSGKNDLKSSNSVYFGKILPRLDTRYVVLTGNLTLVLISVLFCYLQRSFAQISLTLGVAALTEYVLFRNLNKYQNQSFKDRWPSALAEAASCLVLCRSKVLWVHPLMVVVAILSKYLIRRNERDHVFNPANFAILMTLCFVSPVFFEFRVDDYSAGLYPLFHALVVGLVATSLANVWRVTLGYFSAIIVFSALLFPISSLSAFVYALGPEIGTSGVIFAFLMITDPKSAPRKPSSQWTFGAAIALLHLVLRYEQFAYSRFVALFFATAGFYFWDVLTTEVREFRARSTANPLQEEASA